MYYDLIMYTIDSNGEPLVFEHLFYISLFMKNIKFKRLFIISTWGKLSSEGWASCPLYMGRVVLGRVVFRASCLRASCLWGKLSWGELSLRQVVLGRIVFGASCLGASRL